MSWLDRAPHFERRALVFVEDHLYHTTEMLAALSTARPDLIDQLTVCVIERGGPDTTATVTDWLHRYDTLQVAAMTERPSMPAATSDADGPERWLPIAAADLADVAAFAKLIGRQLRPGGVLIQDVQLSTLPFLAADRWWDSIYLAATIRGTFADRPPAVRFLSNKRGYAATFGRDLLDAGFDPRDVMDKSELSAVVVPTVGTLVDRAFPLELEAVRRDEARRRWPVAAHPAERREIEAALDIVLWSDAAGVSLGGRLVGDGAADSRVSLRASSHEAQTWRELLEDRLSRGTGLPVTTVGERVAPEGAVRAEITNLAARHIHTLRGRLSDGAAIITADHAYRLHEGTSAGICGPSPNLPH